ncbi:MAG: efflux RND transporter periplasmic adaptor subunit, partial [Geminicoccales bacterium]
IDDDRVQVVEKERLASRRVDVGIRGSGRVEVRNGVAAGDLVLSPFREDLDDGARIRLKEDDPG